MIYCPNCRKVVNEVFGIGYDHSITDKKGFVRIEKVRDIHCELCHCFIKQSIIIEESNVEI